MIGFTLRSHLADKYVAAFNEGADADDAHLIEVAEAFLSNVGNLSGDLLWPQLGLTCLDLVLLDMHRGVEVVVDQTLTDKDGVLVVVTLPGHVGDQDVLAKSDLTAFTGGTIGQHLTHNHRVTLPNNRTLVQAGVLIGPLILLEEMGVFETFLVLYHNRSGVNEGDGAIHP
ncbi:MAG: Uncharacterised protein [Cyanobium sp. ARS6]|nr:MAG: Uncharacterised protein [Cyanobium sp. ARS6]